MTAHTTNSVSVIFTKYGISVRDCCILADFAPTFLDLLNVEKPAEMTGTTLIAKSGVSFMPYITEVFASEVLDSRGHPTMEVKVTTKSGESGSALIPSGT